jgi:tRNA-dihydrouridine synthase B
MSFWDESIKIGNLTFPRFIGGPLDGITDSPFRQLVRDFSKDELLYTEMRHVRCVAHDKGAAKALRFEQFERPLNFQFAANSAEFVQQACDKVLQAGVDAIDLNIGCPARNVIGSGSGSALMADLHRLEAIVKAFRAAVPLPFTVKIRAGFKEKNAIDVARLLEDCGVDAIAIHPRLQTQRFEGRPDYAYAAQVKQAVSIPVILSGNVVNFKTAQLAYEQTGADGFLIGRGIWAKPWKLQELKAHARGEQYQVDNQTVMRYALKHLDGLVSYYGPHGLFVFRKHLPFYVKGHREATELRRELLRANQIEHVKEKLVSFFGA